jgi:polar amino acid transport system permease protein
MTALLAPHRLILAGFAIALVLWCALTLRWDWLPAYAPLILQGLWTTLWLLVVTSLLGFALAVPLGLAQVTGPAWLAWPARAFCTVIRGTPLLLQIWLLYYGLGSLFPQIPGIRDSWAWPILRDAWPYAVLALTLSYAGYEGEVMRGAFASVPRSQIETGQAYGMGRLTLFRRIWLPQAVRTALPTLAGETILQMKATPLVATITVIDIYAVTSRVRQDLLIVYEPLLVLALCYLALAGLIALGFSLAERRGAGRARR